MNDLARRCLSYVTPRTGKGAVYALFFWLFVMFGWHLVVDWYIAGSRQHSVGELFREIVLVGTPFAAVFVVGGYLQHKAVTALSRRAYFDPLSGVYNRQTFVNHARKAIAHSRHGLFLLIDADHFKRINDTYGHTAGDRCIAAIGHRLNWHTRSNDVAGRLGGEEFAVFLSDVSSQHGHIVASRIGQPVEFTDPSDGSHLSVTLSVGAIWTSPDHPMEEFFQAADEALYLAKSSGRAQLRFADSDEVILLANGEAGTIGQVVNLPARSTSKIQAVLGD